MAIRIILADDHHIFREGLRAMFEQTADMEVVAEAKDGRETVRLAIELSPDVVIMDIAMPELNGIEATRQILVEKPDIRIVALSMHASGRYLNECRKAGAKGYLLKDSPFRDLQRAIRIIMTGGTHFSPNASGSQGLPQTDQQKSDENPVFAVLSARQREVLQLFAEGYTSKEIADHLDLSVKTVDVHRKNIMDKLRIHNVAELIRLAIREGITSV